MRLIQKMRTGLASGSHFKLFPLFFLLILLCNIHLIYNPPHWDEIIGLHNQALFLAKHNFSFTELYAPGQHSYEGSNVYPYSILPILYAVWYSLFSPKTVHLLGHLLNFACMAGTATLLTSVLRSRGVSALCAAGWGIAFLLEPLTYGQTIALGLEPALTFGVMLALWFANRERWNCAMAAAFLAVFLKTSAAVLSFALFLYLLIRISASRSEWKKLRIPLAGFFLIFLFQLFLLQHNVNMTAGGLHTASADAAFSFPVYLLRKAWFHTGLYFPVLVPVFCAGIAFACARIRKNGWDSLLFFLAAAGYAGAYLIARTALPRYMAAAVPAILLLPALNCRNRFVPWGLCVLFFLAPLCYRPLSFGERCSGEYLERNAEHVNQTRANLELCRFLETEHFDSPVVAPWPIVQMLTMPELGYVSKPLPNLYSGRVPFYAPVKKLVSLEAMPPDTLFVYQENDFEKYGMSNPSLRPPPENETLFRARGIAGFTLVYKKNPPDRKITSPSGGK